MDYFFCIEVMLRTPKPLAFLMELGSYSMRCGCLIALEPLLHRGYLSGDPSGTFLDFPF